MQLMYSTALANWANNNFFNIFVNKPFIRILIIGNLQQNFENLVYNFANLFVFNLIFFIFVYKNLWITFDCEEKGWVCHMTPIEVGCRGFIWHSVISFLSKIGITDRSLKVASNRLQTTAQYASSWIWSKERKFSAWRKYTRNHHSRVIT